MKVFIAAPRPVKEPGYAEAVQAVVEVTRQAGHLPFLAYAEIKQRGLTAPEDFMPFVRQHIRASQLLLLLYSQELRGGLIEAGIAYALDAPVWLLHRSSQVVSSSALGCARHACSYKDIDELRWSLSGLYRDHLPAEHIHSPDRGENI